MKIEKIYVMIFLIIFGIICLSKNVSAYSISQLNIEIDGEQIRKNDLNSGILTSPYIINKSYKYTTGMSICPSVYIKYFGEHSTETLAEGIDYTVSYSSDINKGYGTVIINPTNTGKLESKIIVGFLITKDGEQSYALNPNEWNPHPEVGTTTELDSKANIIATVIRDIGLIVSVIALMVIGIKMMVAGVEEKSILKQALPGYLLGVFMIAAISFIPSIIKKITEDMF